MAQLKIWDSVNKVWIPAVVGAVGQTGPKGDTGPGVPAGGDNGTVLTKVGTGPGTDYQTSWQAVTTGVSSVDNLTGAVSLTNNYDAKGTAALKSKFDSFLAKSNGVLNAYPPVKVPTNYGTGTTTVGDANVVAWDSGKFTYRGLVTGQTVTISGTTYVRNNPLNNATTDISYNVYWIEFDHYGQNFDVRYAAASGKRQIWVWVDGSPTTLTSNGLAGTTGVPSFYRVNFDTVAQRRIRIMLGSTDFAGIGLLNASDTIFPVEQKLLKVALFGGSWFQGGAGGVSNLSEQLSVQLGEMLNADYYVLAIGGTGYVNGNQYDPLLGYVANTNNNNGPSWIADSRLSPLLTIQPDLVIFLGTTNDDDYTGTQYKLADHVKYVYDYVKNLASNPKIISFARQSNGQYSTNIASNASIVTAAATAHPSVIGAVDDYSEQWITGTVAGGTGNAPVFIYSDNHPTAAGNHYYATRMFNRIFDFVKTYTRS